MLEDHVVTSSSRWSANKQMPLKALVSSKRRVYESVEAIHTRMSFTTFVRRLRGARLGIGVGSRRVDVCDICECFDNCYSVRVKQVEAQLQRAVAAYSSDVLVKWQAKVEGDAEFSADGFTVAASPRYLTELCEFLAGVVEPGELGGMITICVEALRELIGEALGYSTHFKAVQVQHAAFKADLEKPEPNALYCLWDMQDVLFEKSPGNVVLFVLNTKNTGGANKISKDLNINTGGAKT